MPVKSKDPEKSEKSQEDQAGQPASQDDAAHQGRRYAVSSQRGKAKGKLRYIETNDPKKGCRFLS